MFSLDSLGIERVGAAERVQQYLATEWQARHPDQPANSKHLENIPLIWPKVGSANSTGEACAVTVNTDSLPPFPSDTVSD